MPLDKLHKCRAYSSLQSQLWRERVTNRRVEVTESLDYWHKWLRKLESCHMFGISLKIGHECHFLIVLDFGVEAKWEVKREWILRFWYLGSNLSSQFYYLVYLRWVFKNLFESWFPHLHKGANTTENIHLWELDKIMK